MTDNWIGPLTVFGIIFVYVAATFAVCSLVGRRLKKRREELEAATRPLDETNN